MSAGIARKMIRFAPAALLFLAGCASANPSELMTLQQQVMEAERGFARTMADRDHEAFRTFIADDAIFFSGPNATRGREAIAEEWAAFFEGPQAPFSWEPDQVEVLDSGDLALSTGPVRDPSGNLTGRFNSIWRRDDSGRWLVVFDKGSPVCNCQTGQGN